MDMPGMNMTTPPSPSMNMTMPHKHKMMMHMSFYWGHEATILFRGWPGNSTGMYVLSLFMVFALAVLVEWLSHTRYVESETDDVVSRVVRTMLHGLRMGLAYLVMLALMSFNSGVFVLGSRGFGSGQKNGDGSSVKKSDLPPMIC